MSKFCLFHAVLSLLLLPAAVMPAHNREDRQTFSVQTFKTPDRDYGPMTWWHWINGHITREGIRKDLSAMHDAGLRGVQVFNTHMYLPKGPVKFGSEEWHGMISYALHVCDSLGMKFCITPGAGWSGSGGPWITAEQSMKKLTLSETFVSGGKTDTVLAMPETKGGYYREIAVQAVPAGIQAGTVEDLQAKIMAASKTAVRYDYSDDSSRAVRRDEIIDLTGSVDRDGRLECVLPDGDWCILRFGYTITGKKTHPAAWGGEGYEVDKLDSTDVLVQYEHYLKPLFEKNSRYLGNTFEGILFDSYEAGFQNWTERLPEEFTKMHGYDLLDYMPVFSGRPVESMKVTEQVLYDFRELLDHMLSEFYYGTLKKKINAAGLAVYAEPQGGPVPSMAMDFTDIPMNEFWNPDAYPRMKNMRLTASLADIRGKKIVGAEAFTSKPEDGRWKNWPGTLKKPGDLAWIRAYGWRALETGDLDGHLSDFGAVFNTVPSPVLDAPLLRQLRLDFRHLRGLRGDGFVYRVGLLARQRPALLRLVRNVRAAAQPRDRRVGFILVAEKFLDRLDFLREQVVALLERHVDIRAALLDLHREAAQPVVNRNISDDCGERRASRYHVRLHREIVLLRRPQRAARRHNYTTGPA